MSLHTYYIRTYVVLYYSYTILIIFFSIDIQSFSVWHFAIWPKECTSVWLIRIVDFAIYYHGWRSEFKTILALIRQGWRSPLTSHPSQSNGMDKHSLCVVVERNLSFLQSQFWRTLEKVISHSIYFTSLCLHFAAIAS